MNWPVELHINTEPYRGKDEEGMDFTEVKVTGTVKRGYTTLYEKTLVTRDDIESVCDTKENLALYIELWAVENTDFTPVPENMPY